MVKKLLALTLLLGLMQGCASFISPAGLKDSNCIGLLECVEEPEVIRIPTHAALRQLPPAEKMPVVAVYSFLDKTGQRKQSGG